VIFTNFGSIYRNLGDIFQSRGLLSNLWWPWFALKWIQETFWTLTFDLLGRNIAPLQFKTEGVAETVLRASWFWPTSFRFSGTWEIHSTPGDSKLTPDSLGLQWNRHSNFFLSFELVGRNTAPLHFKTEGVADSALSAPWFWPTSARFAGTWGYFPVPGTLQ